MIDFDYSTMAAFFIVYIIVIVSRKIYRRGFYYILFFSIFYVYLTNLIKFTIFPIPYQSLILDIYRSSSSFKDMVVIIPFKDIIFNKQVFLNILLTIPFGFGINFITTKRKALIWGLLIGPCIELAQLFISLLIRYAYRTIDINDIIFNLIGALVGILLFSIFSVSIRFLQKKIDINQSGLIHYLNTIMK